MRKKCIKKALAVFLMGVMVLGMTGCGKKQEESSVNSQVTNVPETSSNSNASTTITPAKDDKIVYPLQEEDTLTIWSSNQLVPSDEYQSWEESPFHTGLEKRTGVKVEWQYPTKGSDVAQAYNLLLTEDELPNMIFNTYSSGDASTLLSDGVIVDLTEYLPKYAPDFWEYINRPENEIELKSIKTDDGKICFIPAMRETTYNLTWVGPAIRQDWLDECKLETPVTLEDWENVLEIFKENYDACLGFRLSYMGMPGIGSGTGTYATQNATFYVDDNGKIQFAQMQPEWKEYIETLNRWYEKGLIDKDFLTMDDEAIRTKVLNNKIGISITALSQISNWSADAEAAGSEANWVGLGYPRTSVGEPTCYINSAASRANNYAIVVTTSCTEEEIATALRWLNYGYTEEGIMYWNYGEEGLSYELDENGNPKWTDLITQDPLGINRAVEKYIGAYGAAPTIQLSNLVAMKNSENSANAVYAWVENTEVGKHYVPNTSFTEEEKTIFYDKYIPINTYISEMTLKFIVGEESIDNFDSFVKKLEEMGIKDCLDIKQVSYERFMSK